MPEFSFSKGERLTSKKVIATLFQEGNVVISPPFRILYARTVPGEFPAKMAVSVPKRLFKRAVDRNLLKRRIREAYRIRKPDFYGRLSGLGTGVELVIQFQNGQLMDFHTLSEGLSRGIEKLIARLNE
jgi:ribonuclease P protein component